MFYGHEAFTLFYPLQRVLNPPSNCEHLNLEPEP
jgi:hypothetical protein